MPNLSRRMGAYAFTIEMQSPFDRERVIYMQPSPGVPECQWPGIILRDCSIGEIRLAAKRLTGTVIHGCAGMA